MSLMALASCGSHQHSASHTADSNHVYQVESKSMADFTVVQDITYSTADWPQVRAVVAGGIPADLSQYANSPIVVPFLGAQRDEDPQLYKDASPLTHVSAEHPPTFLYHGQRDRLVEKEQSINYYAALRQADVPAELYLHPLWGDIAMFLLGWGAENQGIDFLNQHNGSDV